MRILLFELQKIGKKKNILMILAIFLIANVLLLWYADSLRQFPSASAYQEVQARLQTMEEEQKGAFLLEKYQESAAYRLLLELETIRENPELSEERKQEMIELAVGDDQVILDRFAASYTAGQTPRYTGSFEAETAFWQNLYQHWQATSGYKAKLTQIERDADRLLSISIFHTENTETFSSRNVLKTQADYQRLQGMEIPFTITEGLSYLLQFKMTDALAVCIAFFFALILITEEKQKGLFGILRVTRKGRLPLIAGKMAALAAVLSISTAALYGTNLLYGALRYGLPSLSLPLQAVNGFIDSALPVNIGVFLLLFFVMKWLACFAFTTIIAFVTIHAKDAVTGFLSCALIYGIGAALTELIPPQSVFNALRYINPVGILDTGGILGTYYNLSLAGRPFGLQNVVLVFMLCLTALFTVLSAVSFAIRRNWDTAEFFLLPLLRKIKRKAHGFTGGILRYEIYKALVLNKAGLILVLFCALSAALFPSLVPRLTIQQQRVRNYTTVLMGEATEEKLAFLDEEEQRIEEAHEKIDWIMKQVAEGAISPQAAAELSATYQDMLNREDAFRLVQERVRYVLQNPGTQILFEDGYLQLMYQSGADLPVTVTLAVLILCFAGSFSMEYQTGAIAILSATPGGRRRTVKAKLFCSLIICILVFIASALPTVITVGRIYGLHGFLSPLGSIPAFQGHSIPIVFYILIHYLVQFLTTLAVSVSILSLSNRLRKTTSTLSVCAAVLLLPMVLKAMRVPFAQYFSISPLYNFASGIKTVSGQIRFLITLLLVLTVCIWLLTNLFLRFGTWKTNRLHLKTVPDKTSCGRRCNKNKSAG